MSTAATLEAAAGSAAPSSAPVATNIPDAGTSPDQATIDSIAEAAFFGGQAPAPEAGSTPAAPAAPAAQGAEKKGGEQPKPGEKPAQARKDAGPAAAPAITDADLPKYVSAARALIGAGMKRATIDKLLDTNPGQLLELAADFPTPDAAVGTSAPATGAAPSKTEGSAPAAPVSQPATEAPATPQAVQAATGDFMQALGVREADRPVVDKFVAAITGEGRRQNSELMGVVKELVGIVENVVVDNSRSSLTADFPQLNNPSNLAAIKEDMRALIKTGRYSDNRSAMEAACWSKWGSEVVAARLLKGKQIADKQAVGAASAPAVGPDKGQSLEDDIAERAYFGLASGQNPEQLSRRLAAMLPG